MSEKRMGRIEGEIKKIISDVIAYDLKNPDIKGIISVTGVSLSNDLKYANVYISVFDKKNDNTELQNTVINALNKSKGHIRSKLASKITMRYTPELTFKLDNSLVYGTHINEILNKIMPNNKENQE